VPTAEPVAVGEPYAQAVRLPLVGTGTEPEPEPEPEEPRGDPGKRPDQTPPPQSPVSSAPIGALVSPG